MKVGLIYKSLEGQGYELLFGVSKDLCKSSCPLRADDLPSLFDITKMLP